MDLPADAPLAQARQRIADLQAQLARRGMALRAPPPEPTTCCGRGCNGCVWEGFHAAVDFWVQDAALALSSASR